MHRLSWLLLVTGTTFLSVGCSCSDDAKSVAGPAPTGSLPEGPRLPKPKPEIKLDRVPLNIRSNGQVIFKNVKIGAGNFEAEKRDESGMVTAPARAKLWTAVKGDPKTAQVTKVKVGDTFQVGNLRFKVIAMHIPGSSDSKPFVRSGGDKASITVLSLQ